MSLFTGILEKGAGLLTGRLWQVAAIALLAALIGSSSYLGYQWYQAAQTRDEAVKWLDACNEEKKLALEEVGGLKATIHFQNDAIAVAADETARANDRYVKALMRAEVFSKKVEVLRKDLAARAPSLTCDAALKRQREALDFLKSLRTKEAIQ